MTNCEPATSRSSLVNTDHRVGRTEEIAVSGFACSDLRKVDTKSNSVMTIAFRKMVDGALPSSHPRSENHRG
jgi:hypothetical protein